MYRYLGKRWSGSLLGRSSQLSRRHLDGRIRCHSSLKEKPDFNKVNQAFLEEEQNRLKERLSKEQGGDRQQPKTYDDVKLRQIIDSSNLGMEQRKLKEKELREKELREKESREKELKEKELRERELKEEKLKEKELKEKKLKEKELKEKELTEKEPKDRELNKESIKDTQNKEKSPPVSHEDDISTVTTVDSEKPNKAKVFPTPVSSITTKQIKERIESEFKNLPSQREKMRRELSKKMETYLDSLQDTIFTATRALNDVTGYSSIEKLKKSIEQLEQDLKDCKDQVKQCKDIYAEAIQRRSTLQKEMNDLLTRKHNWNAEDLERFTILYRNDHANEQNEINSQENLNNAEQAVDAIQLKLTQSILTRYHEEQIWSDKIRRASTWGTWILMGINIFLFMIATFFVEPWKRRRLVGSFEDKVKQAITDLHEKQSGHIDDLFSKDKQNITTGPATGLATQSDQEEQSSSLSSWLFDDKPKNTQVPKVSFKVSQLTWTNLKLSVIANYHTLFTSKDVDVVQFDKPELGIIAASLTLTGCVLGSLVMSCFK